jgi:hypothetical protein
MKKLTQMVAVTVLALGLSFVHADKTVVAGPKGGRLLDTEPAKAEFFVEKDRKVSITFYDKDLKPITPKDQTVALIAEPKSGKTKLDMEKKGDALVSTMPLPEGDGYNVVVQVRASSDAKPKNFRIPYLEHECGGCKRVEYACTCDE